MVDSNDEEFISQYEIIWLLQQTLFVILGKIAVTNIPPMHSWNVLGTDK